MKKLLALLMVTGATVTACGVGTVKLPIIEEPGNPDNEEPGNPDNEEPGNPDNEKPGNPDNEEPGNPGNEEPEEPTPANITFNDQINKVKTEFELENVLTPTQDITNGRIDVRWEHIFPAGNSPEYLEIMVFDAEIIVTEDFTRINYRQGFITGIRKDGPEWVPSNDDYDVFHSAFWDATTNELYHSSNNGDFRRINGAYERYSEMSTGFVTHHNIFHGPISWFFVNAMNWFEDIEKTANVEVEIGETINEFTFSDNLKTFDTSIGQDINDPIQNVNFKFDSQTNLPLEIVFRQDSKFDIDVENYNDNFTFTLKYDWSPIDINDYQINYNGETSVDDLNLFESVLKRRIWLM